MNTYLRCDGGVSRSHLREHAGPALVRFDSFEAWFDQAPAPRRILPLVGDAALPVLVVAGAQKSGTTFLRAVLNEHPMLDAGRGVTGRCGGEIHALDGAGARLWDAIAAAAPAARPAHLAAAALGYARGHFRFPTCRGLDAPAPGARPLFFFDTSPHAVVGADDRAFDAPEQLRGTALLLGRATRVALLLRDPVARYAAVSTLTSRRTRR